MLFNVINNIKFLFEVGTSKSNPDTEKERLWHKKLLMEKRPLMLTLIAAAFLLLSGTIVATYLLVHNDIIAGPNDTPGDGDDYRQNIPINSTIGILVLNQNLITYDRQK